MSNALVNIPQVSPGSPIPRKLNDAMIEALSTAIAAGNYPSTAAELCGISRQCLDIWLKEAAKDEAKGKGIEDSLYLTLLYKLKEAEAKAEAAMVGVIREAATVKREWLPATVFLERRYRERWGRPAPVQVNIDQSRTIQITQVEVVLNEPIRTPVLNEVDRDDELPEGVSRDWDNNSR